MQSFTVNTLQALIDDGYTVRAYCNSTECRHGSELDLVALAEKLGPDFVHVGDPNPLAARLRCAKCGAKGVGLILSPSSAPSPGASYRSEAY